MAASVIAKLKPLVVQPTVSHSASLVILHGSGDTGAGVREWIGSLLGKDLAFPHIRVIYPTAPLRPYSAAMGNTSTVWFDRMQISPFVQEDVKSINEMTANLQQVIDAEVQNGIPVNRIVLGGFSMGGAMALYHGYRVGTRLAGVFALSSFLNNDSIVYRAIAEEEEPPFPPLFQAHGLNDPLVNNKWGKRTHEKMKSLNIDCVYHQYPNLHHEMNTEEILLLKEWILHKLPEITES